MNGSISLFTLIALIIAVVVILRLRSVLGRRTGEDDARIERMRTRRPAAEAQAADKVVALPRRDREETPAPAAAQLSAAEAEARVKAFAAGNVNVERGLAELIKQDTGFDPEHFIRGAKQAYEMIVTAFAEGNRKILKELLSPEVLESFTAAIADRENRGEQIDQSFVGIRKAEVVEAEVSKGIANLTVRFVSQLIKAVRDRSGAIIDGDEHRIIEVTDIWTFCRDISTARARQNLNWRLIATQSQA